LNSSPEQLTERQLKERRLLILREQQIRRCRQSFWEYCRTQAPKFYIESRWHLHLICEVLQALYERRLTKAVFNTLFNELAPPWFTEEIDWDRIKDDHVFTRLIQNIPPRLGKSRTLVNYCKWVFGKSTQNRVITCSYNNDLATDFSRYARDGICERRTLPTEIIYSDIFPRTKIKHGNASYQEWALEGEFFNYKGAGVGGTITGKGCNISIVDDPVKDAETAYNETALERIWRWYTGTFLSRLEDEGQGGIEIVNMTRWSAGDICGQLQAGPEADEWLELKMEAAYGQVKNEKTEEVEPVHMLCPSLLSKRKYLSLRRNMDDAIFSANYHQVALDQKGRLYKSFKTYKTLPVDEEGQSLIERTISYTDTADEGSDYLCSLVADEYNKELYIKDILYTKEGMEITEPATAQMLFDNKATEATIESNNGGRGFARNVERELWEKHKSKRPTIKWFHQSKNKIARILSNATYVMDHVYYPANWKDRWPEYYKAMSTFQREGKNKNDDGPDCTTGLVELVTETTTGLLDYYREQAEKMKAAKQ